MKGIATAAIFAGAATLLASAEAFAQSRHDAVAADVLFEEGREALGRGDARVACEKFEASRKLDPAVGTLLNLGVCREKLGERGAAWLALREALRAMPTSDDRRTYTMRRLEALESKLGRVTFKWHPGTEPPSATVLLDGEPIAPPYDVPRVVEPGTIAITVRSPSHRDATTTRQIKEGERLEIQLPVGAPLASAASTSPPASSPTSSSSRLLPISLGLGGLALLGVGSAFGISALTASSSARDRCADSFSCPDDRSLGLARNDANDAQERGTISTVLLASGAVVVGTAVVLYLVTGRAHSRTASRAGAIVW